MSNIRSLSLFLKVYRKKRKLTQVELGKRLGYTSQFIANWESGISRPPLKTLILLKDILELPPKKFLEILVRESLKPYEEIFKNK